MALKETPKERERRLSRQKLGREAQIAAYDKLHEKYKDELETLVIQERVARGLPLRPQGKTADEVEEQIRRDEERLAKRRRELALLRGEA